MVLGVELNGTWKLRKFSDGITFVNFIFEIDSYLGDHTPKLEFSLVIFNYQIFDIEIYNTLHVEAHQIVDKYGVFE